MLKIILYLNSLLENKKNNHISPVSFAGSSLDQGSKIHRNPSTKQNKTNIQNRRWVVEEITFDKFVLASF